MTQEIKINLTLTLEGEVSQPKEAIQDFINDMMINVISTKFFSLQQYQINKIAEEAEIYSLDVPLKMAFGVL